MGEEDLGTDGSFTDVDMDFTITGGPSEPPEDLHGRDGGSTNQCADITQESVGYRPESPQQAQRNDSRSAGQVGAYTFDAHVVNQNLRDLGYPATLGQTLFDIFFWGYTWTNPSAPDILAIVQSPAWRNAVAAANEVARNGFEITDTYGFASRFGL